MRFAAALALAVFSLGVVGVALSQAGGSDGPVPSLEVTYADTDLLVPAGHTTYEIAGQWLIVAPDSWAISSWESCVVVALGDGGCDHESTSAIVITSQPRNDVPPCPAQLSCRELANIHDDSAVFRVAFPLPAESYDLLLFSDHIRQLPIGQNASVATNRYAQGSLGERIELPDSGAAVLICDAAAQPAGCGEPPPGQCVIHIGHISCATSSGTLLVVAGLLTPAEAISLLPQ